MHPVMAIFAKKIKSTKSNTIWLYLLVSGQVKPGGKRLHFTRNRINVRVEGRVIRDKLLKLFYRLPGVEFVLSVHVDC